MIILTRRRAPIHQATRRRLTMSRRKRQRRLEEHYRTQLAPWMAGTLGACVLLMLAIYVATMPL
jgi:hypothetical protein